MDSTSLVISDEIVMRIMNVCFLFDRQRIHALRYLILKFVVNFMNLHGYESVFKVITLICKYNIYPVYLNASFGNDHNINSM